MQPLAASLGLALALSGAQEERARPPTLAEIAGVQEFAELVARDRRVSFSLNTAASAVAVLARTDSTDDRRATALVALGCARAAGERPRIESYAHEGSAEVRQAAALALGELGTGAADVLIDLAGKKARALAECAVVGLTRCGSAVGLEYVRRLAGDASSPLADTARAALAFHDDPPSAPEHDALRRLLELRFDAARRHGLVDGQVWRVLMLRELCEDSDFLGRVVYRAAGGLRRPGVRDHFLEVLLAGGPPDRLRGAVAAMPTELSQMVEVGLWAPSGDDEWRALLTEIDARRLGGLTETLLRRAWLNASVRPEAAALLARSLGEGARGLLDVGAHSPDPAERVRCALALGAMGGDEHAATLAALASDPDARVRAAALVGELVMGGEEAPAEIRARLALDAPPADAARAAHPEWRELVDALALAAASPRARGLLEEQLKRLPAALRLQAAAALVENGSSAAREVLRETLRARSAQGAEGARAIAALARGLGPDDIACLRELFPADADADVQVELAVALLALRDPAALPVLRAALWSEPWNLSVLAGLVWIDVDGIDSLRLELGHPPLGASERDRRRVGFALGEWGGLAEVERLAARWSATDPALQGAVLGALGDRTH